MALNKLWAGINCRPNEFKPHGNLCQLLSLWVKIIKLSSIDFPAGHVSHTPLLEAYAQVIADMLYHDLWSWIIVSVNMLRWYRMCHPHSTVTVPSIDCTTSSQQMGRSVCHEYHCSKSNCYRHKTQLLNFQRKRWDGRHGRIFKTVQ